MRSAHGIEGFTNEVNLIASVQHVNLVQLLGYCFEGEEMVLLFELMENSSLDTYIFGKCPTFFFSFFFLLQAKCILKLNAYYLEIKLKLIWIGFVCRQSQKL